MVIVSVWCDNADTYRAPRGRTRVSAQECSDVALLRISLHVSHVMLMPFFIAFSTAWLRRAACGRKVCRKVPYAGFGPVDVSLIVGETRACCHCRRYLIVLSSLLYASDLSNCRGLSEAQKW